MNEVSQDRVVIRLENDDTDWDKAPEHGDIKKYGYSLHQSKEYKRWYASYDTVKGTIWYMWCRDHFKQIEYNQIPDDLIAGGV